MLTYMYKEAHTEILIIALSATANIEINLSIHKERKRLINCSTSVT